MQRDFRIERVEAGGRVMFHVMADTARLCSVVHQADGWNVMSNTSGKKNSRKGHSTPRRALKSSASSANLRSLASQLPDTFDGFPPIDADRRPPDFDLIDHYAEKQPFA